MRVRGTSRAPIACLILSLAACGAPGSGGIAKPPTAISGSQAKSWMVPQAASGDLLYISYYAAQFVGVFAYPSLKPVGTLTNIGATLGLCTDAAGDVFVGSGGEIREYAHGGTSPIATLSYGNLDAWACSVDPTTGNLAVVSTVAPSGWHGDVAIYKGARGSPKAYRNRAFKTYFGCGYDASGNLFVMGFGKNGSYPNLFAELPRGGTALKIVTLSHTPENEGDVQWDGRYLAVSSPPENAIFQFQIKGSLGKEVGSTTLGSADSSVEQFSFPTIFRSRGQVTQVIGTAFNIGTFMVWNYPAGGYPTKILNQGGDALSAVVSIAHRR